MVHDDPNDLLHRATHEAGHALMAAVSESMLVVEATIVPCSRDGFATDGHVEVKSVRHHEDGFRQMFLLHMGGLAGEYVGNGSFDMERARTDISQARACLERPLAPQLLDYESKKESFYFAAPGRNNRILIGGFLIAVSMINHRRQVFDSLVVNLLRHKTLTGDRVYEIVRQKSSPSFFQSARRKLTSIFGN